MTWASNRRRVFKNIIGELVVVQRARARVCFLFYLRTRANFVHSNLVIFCCLLRAPALLITSFHVPFIWPNGGGGGDRWSMPGLKNSSSSSSRNVRVFRKTKGKTTSTEFCYFLNARDGCCVDDTPSQSSNNNPLLRRPSPFHF